MNRAALRTLLEQLSYLLDLKLLLSFDTLASSAVGLLHNSARGIAHLDIGHVGRSWSWCQLSAVAGENLPIDEVYDRSWEVLKLASMQPKLTRLKSYGPAIISWVRLRFRRGEWEQG